MIGSWFLALAASLAGGGSGAARADAPPEPPAPEARAADAASTDRIVQYVAGNQEYALLAIDPATRTSPGASERLVVFHGGRPVVDIGLVNEREIVAAASGRPEDLVEEGTMESAEISRDGRSAAILSTRYRRAAETRGGSAAPGERIRPSGTTRLSWLDARRPEESFNIPLDEGHWVKELVPLSGGNGLAVSATLGVGAPADLRIYGAGGRLRFRTSVAEASVSGIIPTDNGAFLAAGLEYPDRAGLPDQGVLVFDFLGGTHWVYTWSYGGDAEPVSWNLTETGVLEIRLPERIVRYGPNGHPIGSRPVPPEDLAPPAPPR